MDKSIVLILCFVLCAVSTEINSPAIFVSSFAFGIGYTIVRGGFKFDKDIRDTHKW
jgi:hypothetical protein